MKPSRERGDLHLATLFREQRERASRKVTWRKPRSSSRERWKALWLFGNGFPSRGACGRGVSVGLTQGTVLQNRTMRGTDDDECSEGAEEGMIPLLGLSAR